MNNIIYYYYGINTFSIFENDGKISFNYNNKNYCFMEYDRDKNDLQEQILICEELKRRNIITNEIVQNRFNNYLTPYNGCFYVLIKINVKDYKVGFNDILYIQNNTENFTLKYRFKRNDYVDLWKKKIDFYEKKMNELGDNYKLLKNTFDYYVGLAENAISYLANNNINTYQVVLSHRRINEELNSIDFYNPLNYVIDNRARDFVDYIKSLYFSELISKDNILSLLYYINFSREEIILFIARMLYPTNFLDLVDRILLLNEDEVILRKIINKNEEYIDLLRTLFIYINNDLRLNIPTIEWIIKEYS